VPSNVTSSVDLYMSLGSDMVNELSVTHTHEHETHMLNGMLQSDW